MILRIKMDFILDTQYKTSKHVNGFVAYYKCHIEGVC